MKWEAHVPGRDIAAGMTIEWDEVAMGPPFHRAVVLAVKYRRESKVLGKHISNDETVRVTLQREDGTKLTTSLTANFNYTLMAPIGLPTKPPKAEPDEGNG